MAADPKTERQLRGDAMAALRDLLIWECPVPVPVLDTERPWRWMDTEEIQAALPRMPLAWQRAWRAHVAYQTSGAVFLKITEPPPPATRGAVRSLVFDRVVELLKAKWGRR